MKLLFVRHGESEDDLLDAYGGWADWPLTKTGRAQLEKTSEKLKNSVLNLRKFLHHRFKGLNPAQI